LSVAAETSAVDVTRSPIPDDDMYCNRNLGLLRKKRMKYKKNERGIATVMIAYACTLDGRFDGVDPGKIMDRIRVRRPRKKMSAPAAAATSSTSATTVEAASASASAPPTNVRVLGKRGRVTCNTCKDKIRKKGCCGSHAKCEYVLADKKARMNRLFPLS
jgi:hypothetical protein